MTATATIEEAREAIVEEFSILGDWMQRYEYIIELGRKLPGLPESMRVESHRVQGCQSRVWFYAHREDDLIHYRADSDAMIVRGLIALLLRVYSGRRPDEILATTPAFLEALGLGSHLSGSRANGLHAMVRRIHAFARAAASTAGRAEIDPGVLVQ
jgi:cysteine desulfuration protein SufE